MLIDLAFVLASEVAGELPPSTPGVPMSQMVLGILGASTVTAVAGALIAGFFQRKKLGADATEIITRAATGVMEQVQEDNARLREENVALRTTIEDLRQMVEDHTRVLQLHVVWDAMVITKLAEAGIEDLPPAPPFYGPTSSPSRVRATLDEHTTTD